MPIDKITRRTVEKLTPQEKTYVLYDSELKGFGIRVMPSGVAGYIVEYRPGDGGRGIAKRRMALGRVNELTPDEARTRAQKELAAVRNGEDPLLERELRRKEIKVTELIDKWETEKPMGRKSGKPMADRTRNFMLARLRHHVVPILGKKRVNAVSVEDVNNLIQKITNGDTKRTEKSTKKRGRIIVRGGEGAARKVASDLSIIYGYAKERGIVRDNPVSGARRPQAGKRQDYLRLEDVKAIEGALTALEANNANKAGITILRLIMRTGARPAEIEGLKWSEIDFEGRCLRLTNSKTGYSVRPLSSSAIEILKNVKRVEKTPYVFPATRGTGYYVGSAKIWNQAREMAGLPHRVRYHARHAVATLALSHGHDIASVAAILGHKGPRTTLSTYAHVVDSRAADAAEKVSQRIEQALKSAPTNDDADTVEKSVE